MSSGSCIFLTTSDAEPGFTLAGFRQHSVTVAAVESTLLAILAEAKPELVVVDERLLPGIAPEHFQEMGRRYGGALAVLPGPGRTDGGPDYAEQLIGRAIGYQLRLTADEHH